jgi:hypothetical protein
MTVQRGILTIAAAFALLSSGTGCVHRELIHFHDHGSKPLTSMVVVKRTNYIFSGSEELIWYSCSEQGDKLSCKRMCGGSNDLVCPAAATVYGMAAGTNID